MPAYYGVQRSREYLAHHGVKGQKWGVINERETDGGGSQAIAHIKEKLGLMVKKTGRVASDKLSRMKARGSAKIQLAKEGVKDYLANDSTGRYGKGNIDLNRRQVVHNRDGSISTERSFSANFDGKEVLLPTVINGKVVSERQAINHYLKTGEHLGEFDTPEEADEYAEKLHNRQDWYYNKRKSKKKLSKDAIFDKN